MGILSEVSRASFPPSRTSCRRVLSHGRGWLSVDVYSRAPAGAFSPGRARQFEEAIASWAHPAKLELIEPRSPSKNSGEPDTVQEQLISDNISICPIKIRSVKIITLCTMLFGSRASPGMKPGYSLREIAQQRSFAKKEPRPLARDALLEFSLEARNDSECARPTLLHPFLPQDAVFLTPSPMQITHLSSHTKSNCQFVFLFLTLQVICLQKLKTSCSFYYHGERPGSRSFLGRRQRMCFWPRAFSGDQSTPGPAVTPSPEPGHREVNPDRVFPGLRVFSCLLQGVLH